jgi:peptidoglycan/xylan/chitin deacetylase (PgdA/CDA1 family)
MSLRSTLGMVRRTLLSSRHRRTAALGDSGPFVSFTFDDFPRTAYTAGGTILKNLGVRGTYYVAMGLMNTSNDLGEQFRLDDLYAAADDGHELATHTFNHHSSRRVSLNAFKEDVRKGCDAVREIAGLAPSGNFAYPYGEATLAAKQAVGREMISCRGTSGGRNGPLVDLNLLRANPLYGHLDRLKTAERLILENEKAKGWLIFYTHDVRPNPSVYGCTPELLESVAIAGKRGAKLLPVAEVLQELTTAVGSAVGGIDNSRQDLEDLPEMHLDKLRTVRRQQTI